MSKHTPGPWVVKNQGPALRFRIESEKGELIALTYGQDNQKYDAHLIEAATDLMHAAKEALSDLSWAEKTISDTSFQSSIILLRNAIAKAEGRGTP